MSGRRAGGWGPRLSPTGTWSPRGQRCDRPRILVTCTLVSFSHGLHTGFGHGCPALRSVCPLPPVLHCRHPSERSLQRHRLQVPPRPPAYRSDQGAQASRLSATQWDCPSSWRQDMQRSTKTRQPAQAGTGCHMVGPWPRSVIQPHSAIFRVRRTAHCSEAEHPRLALGHTIQPHRLDPPFCLPCHFPVKSPTLLQGCAGPPCHLRHQRPTTSTGLSGPTGPLAPAPADWLSSDGKVCEPHFQARPLSAHSEFTRSGGSQGD